MARQFIQNIKYNFENFIQRKMNIIIKENYLKLSKRADYNNNVMRITHLDNKNDPISITHGFIFNTVEIRNGNYYLKPNANLVFKCKNTSAKKFLNDFEL